LIERDDEVEELYEKNKKLERIRNNVLASVKNSDISEERKQI
jgi:hypothetical protein